MRTRSRRPRASLRSLRRTHQRGVRRDARARDAQVVANRRARSRRATTATPSAASSSASSRSLGVSAPSSNGHRGRLGRRAGSRSSGRRPRRSHPGQARGCRPGAPRYPFTRTDCNEVHREAEAGEDAGDDPEPDHDLRLRPAHHLEVVVEGRHAEDPLAGQLERRDLQDDRERLGDVDAADDQQKSSVLVTTASAAIAAAEPQRARVAHEDVRGIAVVPEEADAGAGDGRAEQRVLERVLPKRDGGKGERDDHDRPGGQPVEPVSQVHRVAHAR